MEISVFFAARLIEAESSLGIFRLNVGDDLRFLKILFFMVLPFLILKITLPEIIASSKYLYMLMYHPSNPDCSKPELYARGFKVAPTADLRRIANGIMKFVWSAIIFKDGRRNRASFLSSQWCVYDFDDGEYSLDDALKAFCDTRHIIGTTRHHRCGKKDHPPCDRFRVVIPFAHTITNLDQFEHNMLLETRRYPIDPACKDGARYYFPCKEIISIQEDGYSQPVTPLPAKPKTDYTARMIANAKLGISPRWATDQLRRVVPIGERSLTFYRVAKDYLACGVSPDDVMGYILRSATYEAGITPEARKKIAEAIASAGKSLRIEMERNPSKKGENDDVTTKKT